MADYSPAGKSCIVTGAGAGLGRAMTLALAAAGAHVVAADVNEAEAQTTARAAQEAGSPGRIAVQQTDVRKEEACGAAVARAIAEFGRLDVLVNCAGLNMVLFSKDFLTDLVRFWTVDPDKWQMLYDVNVRGPFLMSRAAAPHMIAKKWGRIVNVTTSYSTMIREGNTPYGQAKAALEAASHCWAEDLEGTGVTCNVLIPGGAADTAMIPDHAPIDRGRLVAPEAMGAPVCFLASDASDGVNKMRIVARGWKEDASIAENLKACMAPAAWPDLAAGASPGAPVKGSVASMQGR
ncbi:MAG: SDR family NAD(P)-dependent oxidoreductase [Beijerinckiaceae bacterium]